MLLLPQLLGEKLANELVCSSSIPTVRCTVSPDGKTVKLLSNKANRQLLKLAKVFIHDHYHSWIHPSCIRERAKYLTDAIARRYV